jgi:hypothetical protein
MKKGGGRFLKSLCLDRYDILIRRFGKKVDLEGMDLMGLVHLKWNTVQNPFNIFDVVHVMVDIDIAVANLIRLLRFRLNRCRKLFRLLGRRKRIEQMPKMSEERLNLLRPPALQIKDQPGAPGGSQNLAR